MFVCVCVQMTDHLQQIEEEAMFKTVELEKQLLESDAGLERLRVCTTFT